MNAVDSEARHMVVKTMQQITQVSERLLQVVQILETQQATIRALIEGDYGHARRLAELTRREGKR